MYQYIKNVSKYRKIGRLVQVGEVGRGALSKPQTRLEGREEKVWRGFLTQWHVVLCGRCPVLCSRVSRVPSLHPLGQAEC